MHELIHGYTYIGFDKDGNAWTTQAFGSSDLRIIEGLAEYYSELLCHDYFDFVLEPFNCLQEIAGRNTLLISNGSINMKKTSTKKSDSYF